MLTNDPGTCLLVRGTGHAADTPLRAARARTLRPSPDSYRQFSEKRHSTQVGVLRFFRRVGTKLYISPRRGPDNAWRPQNGKSRTATHRHASFQVYVSSLCVQRGHAIVFVVAGLMNEGGRQTEREVGLSIQPSKGFPSGNPEAANGKSHTYFLSLSRAYF